MTLRRRIVKTYHCIVRFPDTCADAYVKADDANAAARLAEKIISNIPLTALRSGMKPDSFAKKS